MQCLITELRVASQLFLESCVTIVCTTETATQQHALTILGKLQCGLPRVLPRPFLGHLRLSSFGLAVVNCSSTHSA